MTDPTAKGYTASWEHRNEIPASKPTLEEMMIRDATAKAVPESEDEAFEIAWYDYMGETRESNSKTEARFWWNARARMDAERGE
jgi:hypothetical protein